MNKKILLIYLLFFASINALATLAPIDCPSDGVAVKNAQKNHVACTQLDAAQHQIAPHETHTGLVDNFDQLDNHNKGASGALIFILLIPALLVFVFSGFKKSNK